MERPLVSLALSAYNQRRFVAEAVASALAQTYSPLEVLLSDDASTDGTFDIMKEMAAAYRGPHKVILNRNRTNNGTAQHINRQIELLAGVVYVGMAGDDVSLPERTEKSMQAFLVGGGRVQCVWTNATYVDDRGQETGSYQPDGFQGLHNRAMPVISMRRHPWVLGATSTYLMTVFREFGALDSRIMQEDRALSLRAALRGEVHYLPSRLVRYRRHGNNVYDYEKQSCESTMGLARDLDNKIGLARQAMKDCMLAKTRGWISAREADFYWWSNCRILLVEGVVRHGLLGRNFHGKRFAIKAASKLRARLLELDDAARARVFGVVAE